MHVSHRFIGAALIAGLCSGAIAQSSYDTEASWTGGTIAGLDSASPTIGQTFVAPTSGGYNVLDDYSFWMAYDSVKASGKDMFAAEVYQWNPSTQSLGTEIFSENLGMLTFSNSSLTQITVDPNVVLTPGANYVALITDTSGKSAFYQSYLFNNPAGGGGGQMVYGAAASQTEDGDLGWHADFSRPSATPEPFTIAVGLAGLSIAFRRRSAAKVVR